VTVNETCYLNLHIVMSMSFLLVGFQYIWH